jgi:WD40 repeat protein
MWYYALDGERHGPVDKSKIQNLIDRGDLVRDDFVWNSAMEDWKPISEVEDFHPSPPSFPHEKNSPPDRNVSDEKSELEKEGQKWSHGISVIVSIVVFVVAGLIGVVEMYDSDPYTVLTGHEKEVNSVAFSPDGSLLATASNDGTARLWSVQTGEEVRTLRGHREFVYSVAFSPDGSFLATGGGDKTAKLWSVETGIKNKTFSGHVSNLVYSLAFSPKGSLLATGGFDGTVRIWSVETGRELQVLETHKLRVTSVAFSPDGSLLATKAAGDAETETSEHAVKIWSVETGKEIRSLGGSSEGSVAFSPDGSLLATGKTLWSTQTWEKAQVSKGRHEDSGMSVAFSPDGSLVATVGSDGTARLWSAQTGKEVQVLRGHEDWVQSVTFSPDGSLVATGSSDGTARLWNVSKGL